jgi:hypothetical protein
MTETTMKRSSNARRMKRLAALAGLVTGTGIIALGADLSRPIAGPDLVFEEVDGLVAVEAEHFFEQTLTDRRAWYLTSGKSAPSVGRDGDPAHAAGASGGAYVECLPDTRRTHDDKLISGENFSNTAGQMAVLHYKIHFNNPGRYHVWVRAYSSGSEDNGIHVGLNGDWPSSGQRLQWCEGKNTWRWESKQRTEQQHCGEPYKIHLDIPTSGTHEILFSMREDGFEFDKFILTRDRDFVRPADAGPAPRVKSGRLPASFPMVAASPDKKPFPARWGEPPRIQTMDYRELPGGFGFGSSTLASWIQRNLDADAAREASNLTMEAGVFPVQGTGYYLDRGKWLAINPDRNETPKTASAFPFPSGRYDVTLQAVGESDGKSAYQVLVNDSEIGVFVCPLSTQTYEEGPAFAAQWKKVAINGGDVVTVASKIASEDGQEHSRARWARLVFVPADQATKTAVAKMPKAAAAPAPASQPSVPLIPLVLPRQPDGDGSVTISGELKQWHNVALTLDGPYAHELDNEPNPFTDLALTVTFTHESGSPRYRVPGYFAADGNAGNSSATAGTKWRAHLSPDKAGKWTYQVSFRKGALAALDGGGTAVEPYDGRSGGFSVAPTDKTGRDFRAKGRLEYVGKHFLRHAGTGEYFLKAGPDAPETLLAYEDFDGTLPSPTDVQRPGEAKPRKALHRYEPHVRDWRPGDPTWQGGKGRGLIGAMNYLASEGLNSFSFLPYNAGGDGDNIWPFVSRDDKFHYDVSKLAQWGIVFDHATARGLHLHFKMQENEMDDDRRGHDAKPGRVPESLDGGRLGPERKLYCRELIARFAHNLGLNWNIGEENTQSTEEVNAMINYLRQVDPYDHNVVIHTFPDQQDKVYTPLLGERSQLTGTSLQNSWNQTHRRTLKWVTESAAAGKPWVVANDEQGSADTGVPPDLGYQGYDGTKRDGKRVQTPDDIRKATLWGNLMAGGAGVEYYFGYQLPENDLVCEDWRSRDQSWDYCRHALRFFRDNQIPFWEMRNANGLVGNPRNDNNRYCLAKVGEVYVVFLAEGGSTELDLSAAAGQFDVMWFNPRTGGALQAGAVGSVEGGRKVSLGAPPSDTGKDWVVLVRK